MEKRAADRDKTSRLTALYGMMIALAVLFSYVEMLIPLNLGIPGVKLGLANLVTIVAFYTIGVKEAVAITLVRIVLVGITFSNLFSMLYSLAGGELSLILMILCRKRDWYGQTGVSIVGGVGHNVGQLIVAAIVVENTAVFYYFPYLLVAGIIAGMLIGILGGIVVNRLSRFIRNL